MRSAVLDRLGILMHNSLRRSNYCNVRSRFLHLRWGRRLIIVVLGRRHGDGGNGAD